MKIAKLIDKMIVFFTGSTHDIEHFIKVWSYARTIGMLENLDSETQFILEVTAITHDIACPLCREKYGSTEKKYQETEGAIMVRDFLSSTDLTEKEIDRVSFLIGHHHTFTDIDGLDYQILVEADYIVNATEKEYSKNNIENFIDKVMKTESGIRITREVFNL